MHPFLVLSGASEATLSQWGNIHKLYRLYIFLRERHHCVLYLPNGKATHWPKVYSFIALKVFNTCQTLLEGVCGCIMSCTLFLTGPRQVTKRVHCFIAELITHTVCECNAPEWDELVSKHKPMEDRSFCP